MTDIARAELKRPPRINVCVKNFSSRKAECVIAVFILRRAIDTIVVNLFGAPGSGKSTGAAYIFSKLKMLGVDAELVTEYAKDKVWENNTIALSNQTYVFGKQHFRISRCEDKVDVIIVSMHWGEEYLFEPTDSQKEIAEYLSKLGVNLIIGSHPHVVEPVGYVNDTLVIYSLGNFLSGQRPMGIDKTIGLMVGMDIVVKDKKVTFENIDKSLLYTYSTTSDTNYKVYPFKNLDDSILSGYKELEEKYMGIVNSEVKYD